jgi:molybdate/tungstate transport system ATP-binding protein
MIKRGQFLLKDIKFTISAKQYVVLMGHTGCGKTSLMEAITGLEKIESGELIINGHNMTNSEPSQRSVGYVPQDCALFSSMSVKENIGFALYIRKIEKELIEKKVNDLADSLSLKDLLNQSVKTLSGGEKQKVALARALIFDPDVLLLDEPLNALDEKTHSELCDFLIDLKNKKSTTILHVTHNLSEAQRLAEVIYIMEEGKVVLKKS